MNPGVWTLERVLKLRQRETREPSKSYFTEGVRFVVTAADAGSAFHCPIVAPKLLRKPFGQMIARRLKARGVPTIQVWAEEHGRVSQAEVAQGIAALIPKRIHDSRRIDDSSGGDQRKVQRDG